jgi:hypothetical protein
MPVSSVPQVAYRLPLTSPDDLAFHDGVLLVGEYDAGRIALVRGLAIERLPAHIPEVEGMAYIGERLFAADQLHDRVVEVTGSQLRTVIQLTPVAGVEGVDGIAATKTALIVPDAARGLVHLVAPDGNVLRTVGGFARPAGAWAANDGSILVADENAPGVFQARADGSRTRLSVLPLADDVVQDSRGRIFAVAVTPPKLVEVTGGTTRVLANGLNGWEGQGLILDGAENLVLDWSGIDVFVLNFKVRPLPSARLDPGQAVCLQLVRNPTFHAAVEIGGGPGYRVAKQFGSGNEAAVVPEPCVQSSCRLHLKAASGPLADDVWIEYQGG